LKRARDPISRGLWQILRYHTQSSPVEKKEPGGMKNQVKTLWHRRQTTIHNCKKKTEKRNLERYSIQLEDVASSVLSRRRHAKSRIITRNKRKLFLIWFNHLYTPTKPTESHPE
jgi:hypothetical protein